MGPDTCRGETVGFFTKLFGLGGDGASKRTVDAGQICEKCGEPVPHANMAFDSGSGGPIHRKCPENSSEAPNRPATT
jgi:hypothetical protein